MIFLIILLILIFIIIFILYKSHTFTKSYYHNSANEYFDGIRFKRIGLDEKVKSVKSISTLAMLGHISGLRKNKELSWESWEEKNISVNQSIPKERVFGDTIRYYFINHSTILIQTNELNIITDPIYSKRAGFLIFGPLRVHKAGINFKDLPKIDLILLSHSHYDHFDNKTLLRLFKRDNPTVITPVGNDFLLKKLNKKFKVVPLLWNEKTEFKGLKITLVKAYHWTRRTISDTNKALWGGFVIETESKKIYFAGDTAFGNEDGKIFKEIGNKFNQIDLAFLPIGAYLPYRFMSNGHTSPEDSVRIHKLLNAKQSVAIHFGTFQLSAEKRLEPLEDLSKAKEKHGLQENEFTVLKPSEFGELK